jgi:hypothetical protein
MSEVEAESESVEAPPPTAATSGAAARRVYVYGNGVFRVPDVPLSAQDAEVIGDVAQYYEDHPEALRELDRINEGRLRAADGTLISVRRIDWFHSNYARSHRPTIFIPSPAPEAPDRQRIVKVFSACENATQKFTSERFQRFRRGAEVQFILPPREGENAEPKVCRSAPGQINWFAWCLRNGILQFIVKHAAEIKRDESSKRAKHRADAAEAADGCGGGGNGDNGGGKKHSTAKKGHPAAEAAAPRASAAAATYRRGGVFKARKRKWLTPDRASACHGINLENLMVVFGQPGALPVTTMRSDLSARSPV